MLDGRVTVNGVTVRELGTKADASRDDIRVDGRRVKIVTAHRYLLLNKPRGYVTTRADEKHRPTVIDLLRGVSEYVYPVGRLDYESEGLLLLTNDGDLAARLTHPSHGVPRVYEARVLGVPDGHDLARLSRGLVIDGRRTEAADIRLLPHPVTPGGHARRHDPRGRNRQVRRMCEAVGDPVTRLKRVAIGPIRDSTLKVGRWRELRPEEVERLRKAAAHKPSSESPQRTPRTQRKDQNS
jgi:pseudouridine synthase